VERQSDGEAELVLTIDVQVHAYERDRPGRPWAAVLHGPKEVTGDDMVKAMDEVGVDGALLVSPYTMYRFDPSYALEVRAAYPGRFAVIKPVDPNDPRWPIRSPTGRTPRGRSPSGS
jgi:hypothetical protein